MTVGWRVFPQRRVLQLQDHAARLIDARKPGTKLEQLARDLLAAFEKLCMESGLDGTLVKLGVDDSTDLADHPTYVPAVVAQLEAIALDGGGPRSAKPRQCAECVITALGLVPGDEPERPTITLGADVRTAATAALASVIDVELAAPRLRETIVAEARSHCEERHLAAFEKIAKQLDDRGMHLLQTPKVPLDALHAIQRQLSHARDAGIERFGNAALDGVKRVLEGANAEAAARIDQPVTHRLTPRDVAILRAQSPGVPKTPAAVAATLLDTVVEVAQLAWHTAERAVRVYSPSQTFAVGDLVEHPKFGRGTVVSVDGQRMEATFGDASYKLVHARK